MQLILNQLEACEVLAEEDADTGENEDEVSFIYYGDNCTCSKNSMCKSSKCLCFLRGELCTSSCHSGLKTKCVNK